MLYFILCVLFSFAVSVLLGRKFIPVLRSKKMGQIILNIGPRWHKSKEGTPTMGGLFFIAPFVLLVAAFGIAPAVKNGNLAELLIHSAFMLFCGFTGFIDDRTKFYKKQNEGLTEKQKLLLQFASSALYLLGLRLCGALETRILLPFGLGSAELGIFFYVIAILGIVYTVNAVNLTDGVDGLCASITLVVAIALTFLARRTESETALVFLGCIIGGMLGFLFYNFHPAKVFMGDTGSLFLGGFIVCICFMLGYPVLVLFAGFVYILEALSAVIQVASIMLFKKAVFKMAPIHHHFELSGWREVKITVVFSLVAAAFAALGVFGFWNV